MTIDPEPRDWRLEAELSGSPLAEAGRTHGSILDRLLELLRGPGPEKDAAISAGPGLSGEVQRALGSEIVVTHDGRRLFAYAETEQSIERARATLAALLARQGVQGGMRVSHWDARHGLWAQTDPPLGGDAHARLEQLERDEDAAETRTLVASSGRLDRAEFEASMTRYAKEIGLHLEIVEHPHLLTVQVAFKLTGTRHQIDEFAEGMRAYGEGSVRAELAIAASPL